MSSRQIRKIQQQRELELAKQRDEKLVEEGSDEDEEDIYHAPSKPSAFSAFAALQDEDEDNDEEEGIDNEPTSDTLSKAEDDVDTDEGFATAPPPKAKKSKKKKKKKSKAKTPDSNVYSAEGDDIDAALRELNLKQVNTEAQNSNDEPRLDPEYERVCALLGVNNQYLKVANEMRNLFGRTAADPQDDAGGTVPRGGRRRQRGAQQQIDLETALRGHHAPGKGLPELTLRRNIFIQGKEEWPRATTGGLTMEIVDDLSAIDGTIEFRFAHDQAYEAVQNQFRMFVEMGDPQNLIGLLQRNPYHISLLLQVSKIAKDQSDHSLYNDLIERALFTFARASTSLFSTKLSQGKARLDFARPENRELWLAGYHYIRSLTMKGTYRTAFEWAKLLMSLDPEDDPYCMHLMLHHLALRAHEFEWLSRYATSTIFNFKESYSGQIISPSVALAHMSLRDGATCREILRGAIKKMPYLFGKLFKELNLGDAPVSIWGVRPKNNAEDLYSEIYVRQTKDLWNTPEATSLLMEVAHAAGKSDPADIMSIDYTAITLEMARFVYLDNTPALMALVPSSLLHRIPNSDSDPLPPDLKDNIFSWPSQELPWQHVREESGSGSALAGHFDPISALRALIPGWTGDGGEADEDAIERTGLRELMERDMDHGFGDVEAASAASDQEDPEPEENLSSVSRLYRFLFGSRASFPERPGEDSSPDTDSSQPAGTTDDLRHTPHTEAPGEHEDQL